MKSIQDRVLTRIRGKGSGAVFVPADFLDLGRRAAVDQALARLARAGTIRRVARGVYDLPQHDPRIGALSPSLARVAAAVARATGSQLQVSGAQAANQLGLSTQVPARLTYLTDGATRTIRVGSRAIVFRHAAPRKLAGAGTAAGVVMQALRHLGPTGVTPDVIARIRKVLRDDDCAAVGRHRTMAPAWMRPALEAIAAPAERGARAAHG